MGEIIMRNGNLRELCVQVNLPSQIRQVWVMIQTAIMTIRGLPNPARQVVPMISHIRSYPPHHCHLHPLSLSFSSTIQPSSQNTKFSHPSLSLHAVIMSWHRVQHTPSTAYTKCSIHRVQHPPQIVCHLFIPTITSWSLNIVSASNVSAYIVGRQQPALHARLNVKWHCHDPTVACWPIDE